MAATNETPVFPDPEVTALYAGRSLDSQQIQAIIPHRPPFLLVDRVTALEPAVSAVGLKCVTTNEWFFGGHFPSYPVMPGVLIIEAGAQLAGVVVLTGLRPGNWLPLFTGIERAKFRRPVRPGDQLELRADIQSVRPRFGRLMAVIALQGWVEGQLAAEAMGSFALVNEQA